MHCRMGYRFRDWICWGVVPNIFIPQKMRVKGNKILDIGILL